MRKLHSIGSVGGVGLGTVFVLIIPIILLIGSVLVAASEWETFDFQGEPVWVVGSINWSSFDPGEAREGRLAEAEELFNTTIDQIAPSDYVEEITARVLAGDSTHDIIRRGMAHGLLNVMADGLLYPVGDILPAEHYERLNPVDRFNAKTFQMDGSVYGFGSLMGAGYQGPGFYFSAYNKTMFERYGQPDPYELYADGEWNYDAVTPIARALTMDTIGDGNIDQWGMSDWDMRSIQQFLCTNAAMMVSEVDGRQVYTLNEEPAQQVLRQLSEWREEGLTHGGLEEFIDGQVGMRLTTRTGEMRHPTARMDDDYSIVPMPMGPNDTEHRYSMSDVRTNFLPVNAAEPDGLVALTEFLYRYDDFPTDYEQLIENMPDRQAYEMVHRAFQEYTLDFQDLYRGAVGGPWDIFSETLDEILAGRIGVGAGTDSVQPEVQAWLDDLWRQ